MSLENPAIPLAPSRQLRAVMLLDATSHVEQISVPLTRERQTGSRLPVK